MGYLKKPQRVEPTPPVNIAGPADKLAAVLYQMYVDGMNDVDPPKDFNRRAERVFAELVAPMVLNRSDVETVVNMFRRADISLTGGGETTIRMVVFNGAEADAVNRLYEAFPAKLITPGGPT